jgi:hypothetical protein
MACPSGKLAVRVCKATRKAKLPPNEYPTMPIHGGVKRWATSCNGIDNLAQFVRTEKVRVEMVSIAMVAKIEPKHIEAGLQQSCGGMQHIVGARTAFPTVQQYHQAVCDGLHGLTSEKALQYHPIAALQQM